ncbi:MAG: hypothetical protein R6U13_15890 [Desulfatiglandaceae bacterium]
MTPKKRIEAALPLDAIKKASNQNQEPVIHFLKNSMICGAEAKARRL